MKNISTLKAIPSKSTLIKTVQDKNSPFSAPVFWPMLRMLPYNYEKTGQKIVNFGRELFCSWYSYQEWTLETDPEIGFYSTFVFPKKLMQNTQWWDYFYSNKLSGKVLLQQFIILKLITIFWKKPKLSPIQRYIYCFCNLVNRN